MSEVALAPTVAEDPPKRRIGRIAAWIVGIPTLSGIVIIVGGFLFVMAVFTFLDQGRKALRSRGSNPNAPRG